jgi:hypothetical protein
MKVTTRTCDLCHGIATGKLAKLSAPKKWAKGDYAEDAPKPEAHDASARMFMSMFSMVEEEKHVEIDVCRHCFKALFGAAAWLRELIETGVAK